MSAKYEILKFLVKAMNLKKRFAVSNVEEMLESRRKSNAKNKIPNLKDKAIEVTRIDIMGFPVLKMIHKEPSRRANLFLIGTGMVTAPGPSAFKNALKIAKITGLDLYVPYYPLCTDYPLSKAYEMIHETYREMLRHYEAEHVSVLGYSSGANLALGMVPYIHDGHEEVPMPSRIIAISPGNCLETEEEWKRLLEIDQKDLVTNAEYMRCAIEVMRHGEQNLPDYMPWLQKGDYRGCPPVDLFYGTDECLYAFEPAIEAALKKYGVPYRLIVGEGLYHCYPVFPYCPEAKQGWNEMIQILKESCK